MLIGHVTSEDCKNQYRCSEMTEIAPVSKGALQKLFLNQS